MSALLRESKRVFVSGLALIGFRRRFWVTFVNLQEAFGLSRFGSIGFVQAF